MAYGTSLCAGCMHYVQWGDVTIFFVAISRISARVGGTGPYKKIEEKNSVKPVLAGLEMKAQAGQKIGQ